MERMNTCRSFSSLKVTLRVAVDDCKKIGADKSQVDNLFLFPVDSHPGIEKKFGDLFLGQIVQRIDVFNLGKIGPDRRFAHFRFLGMQVADSRAVEKL